MRGSIPRLSAKFFLTRSLVVEQHTFNVQVEVFDSLRVNQVLRFNMEYDEVFVNSFFMEQKMSEIQKIIQDLRGLLSNEYLDNDEYETVCQAIRMLGGTP